MKRRPEDTVAVLNGLLVLLVPLLLLAAGPYVFDGDNNTSVTVRAPGASVTGSFLALGQTAAVLVPFAILAGWRTWVHARQWGEGRGTGWRGVGESGATALAVALIVLAPGIVTRPAQAPPYVLFYGGAASFLGLLVGLILRTTALLLLRIQRTRAA